MSSIVNQGNKINRSGIVNCRKKKLPVKHQSVITLSREKIGVVGVERERIFDHIKVFFKFHF